jgi:GntR family transcriptional regulator, transcriptional repressor for pyruvate dehydrogenase complex
MSSAFPPPAHARKHRNLAQGIVAFITEQLHNGSLNPGDKLPTESEIMRSQAVSRTVVREAISHLQAAGLVETRHGIGTFVLAPPPASAVGIDPATIVTMHDVLAILELRISLETEAAGLAAVRRTEAQLDGIRDVLGDFLRAAEAGGETVGLDVQFHLKIAEASGNRYFFDILHHLGTNIIPRARLNSAKLLQDDPARYMDRVCREHQDIVDAISRHDPESARAAMRIHLSNSRERLRRAQELIEAAKP